MPATDLVLASGSTYRARMLAEAGFRVTIDRPDVDERSFDWWFDEVPPEEFALDLARRKLQAVAPRHADAVVVAADQVGVLDVDGRTRQLTKQPTHAGAVAQLVSMSGTTHRLINGVVVGRTGPDGALVAQVEGIDTQVVTMRAYTSEEAEEYVRRFEPFDSSGSYRLEDAERMAPGEAFVAHVTGEDRSGVLGMPLPLLRRLLAELTG
jgi:septum formation protein